MPGDIGRVRMPASDSQLIEAFQRGDESAFEALFERYRSRVVNIANRFLGDRDAAQDTAQEVFVKVYTSARDYRPGAEFSTWLYRVTANACYDALRKRKRSPVAPAADIPETIPDTSASPEAQAASSDLAREVRSAISALPPNQRLAVILQRFEGLSYQQIAAVLKTSVPAVESLLFRAKSSLRAALAGYVEGSHEQQVATEAEKKP